MPRPKIKLANVKAYIPIGLPLISTIIDGTGFKADTIRALFHQFYMERLKGFSHIKIREKSFFKEGWVNLKAATLEKVVSHKVKKILIHLESLGIIQIYKGENGKKKYSKNGFSQLYRINPMYLKNNNSVRHFRKELISNHCTLKSIQKIKSEFHLMGNNAIISAPIIKDLSRMLSLFYFDLQSAENFLNNVISGESKIKPTKSGEARNLSDLLLMVDAITSNEIYWETVDSFGERYHTPMTNILGDLRCFLKLKGFEHESLVSLDFTNSQPYFVSIASDSELIRTILPEFSCCIPILKELEAKPDFILFKDLCSKGKLYEYWKDLRGIDREQAKAELLYIMYKKATLARGKLTPQQIEQNHAVREFKNYFPAVFSSFTQLKQITEKELPFIQTLYFDKKGNFAKHYYKNLSCMMQRMESRIVLKKIAPALIEKQITPFITIHDSFILPESLVVKAHEIIIEEFLKLGVKPPSIKIKKLN